MKTLYFLLLLCLLSSCGNREKNDLERRRDQIRADRERNAELEAKRVEQAKSDSLAAIAWGDAIWGMTKEELLKTRAFRNGKDTGYTIEMNDTRKEETKRIFGLKNLLSLRAYFNHDRLQSVFIDSWGVRIDKFDELARECIMLKNNFFRLYGRTKSDKAISLSGFDSDGLLPVAEYNVSSGANKTISIVLRKRGSEYSYSVSIYPLSNNRESISLSKWIDKADATGKQDDVTVFSF